MRKILSIDGGGIKGVFPAAFLATIEERTERPIAGYFDLIAGTSTGGIIALGLGLGFSAAEVLAFYEALGPEVFRGSRLLRFVRWLTSGIYDSGPLRAALEGQFGERRLGESKTRLVIPSLNLLTGEVHIWKTAHHPRFELDYREPAVEAALATAAAPTSFPVHRGARGLPLIDGGLWANNPVGVAVVEAVGVLGWQAEEVRVLSLGCTTQALDVRPRRRFWRGAGYWLLRGTEVFMAGQSSGSLGTAQSLLGRERIIRINPPVARGRYSLDDVAGIPELKGLGHAEARKALPELRSVFFEQSAEAFEPYHRL